MTARQDAFVRKFESAGRYLGSPPESLISVKVRGPVYHSEYRELLDALGSAGIAAGPAQGDFQGAGHSVSYGDQRAIVVEHETGLEVLYVISSSATLVGLVLQVWTMIRSRQRSPRDRGRPDTQETRYLSPLGELVEETVPVLPAIGLSIPVEDLRRRVDGLELLLRKYAADAEQLQSRVTQLETNSGSPKAPPSSDRRGRSASASGRGGRKRRD
ncbi:MAG: hypothetical protein ACE149_17935 [Armatimonadota bacterium]